MPKRSRHPGPRARAIHPAQLGDDYSYVVDKFWIVLNTLDDDQVVLQTRRGKTHTVQLSDPLLRKAGWWDRFRHRHRFPDPSALTEQSPAANSDKAPEEVAPHTKSTT